MRPYGLFIIGLFLLLPVAMAANTQSTTFFDDFVASGFPIQWAAGNIVQINNSTQQGGYLISTVQRNAQLLSNFFTLSLIGNVTSQPPLDGSLNASFTQVTFKLQPFNITSLESTTNSNAGIVADLQIGMMNSFAGGNANINPSNSFFFDIVQGNKPLGLMCTCPSTKSAIFLSINKGPANGAVTFLSNAAGGLGNQNAVLYSPGTTASLNFDPNAQHVFTISINIDINNPTKEYISYKVDNNAQVTLWQSACNCIGSTFPVKNMYPFMFLSTVDYGVGMQSQVLSQSVATQTDYVLVANYNVTTLPQGQLLSSNINPPTHNQGIYQNGGFSLVQYIQFESWSMGQGNVYAGGLLLTGLFLLILSIGLGGVYIKIRIASIVGWIWNISTIALVFIMYYCGVIPLVLPALTIIGAAAIAFGIVKSGPTGRSGGVVPD